MRHRLAAVLSLGALLPLMSLGALVTLAACGHDDPGKKDAVLASGTPEERAKARLLEFFEIAKKGNGASAAELVAYKGKDEARRYKDSVGYSSDDAKKAVDRIVSPVSEALRLGPPVFESSRKETRGSEAWATWTVRFGEGATSKTLVFGLVDAKGRLLIGDFAEPATK